MTTDQWVTERLGGHIKLAIPERREAVKELAEDGLTQRQIADVVGVDQATVHRDINDANASKESANRAQNDQLIDANASTIDIAEDGEWQESPPLLSIVDTQTGVALGTVNNDLGVQNRTVEHQSEGEKPAGTVQNRTIEANDDSQPRPKWRKCARKRRVTATDSLSKWRKCARRRRLARVAAVPVRGRNRVDVVNSIAIRARVGERQSPAPFV
jgi:transposase-like protein